MVVAPSRAVRPRALVRSQRHEGISADGTPGRYEAGDRRDAEQHPDHGREHGRVARRRPEQHRRDERTGAERDDRPRCHAHGGKRVPSVLKYEPLTIMPAILRASAPSPREIAFTENCIE